MVSTMSEELTPEEIIPIEAMMRGVGLTRDLSFKAIKAAHKATKVIADDEGSAIVPDHKIRLDAARLASELRGDLNKWKVELGVVDDFMNEVLQEIGNASPEVRDRIIQSLKEKGVIR